MKEVSRLKPAEDNFAIFVVDLMLRIEKRILPVIEDLANKQKKALMPEDVSIPKQKESDSYQGWASRLIKVRLPLLHDSERKRTLTTSVNFLRVS